MSRFGGAKHRKEWGSFESDGGRLLTSYDDRDLRKMEEEARNVRIFTRVYTLTQVLGILIIGLFVFWLLLYRDGFAWQNNPKLEFNWHPLLMFLGMIFLYGNGILIYRAFRTEAKRKLKIIHAAFNICALLFAVIGLKAVFDSHNLNIGDDSKPKPLPNLYSLHSWIGLTVVLMFCCQWLFGLVNFLFPGMRPAVRSFYLPIHQFFGIAIFVGACTSALLGLTEKALFSVTGYSEKSSEGSLVNVIGLFVVVFCGLVVYLGSNPAYKRRSTEEEILLTEASLE